MVSELGKRRRGAMRRLEENADEDPAFQEEFGAAKKPEPEKPKQQEESTLEQVCDISCEFAQHGAAFTSNGLRVVTFDSMGTRIYAFNGAAIVPQHFFCYVSDACSVAAYPPEGKSFVVGKADGHIEYFLHEKNDQYKRKTKKMLRGPVDAVDCSSDGEFVALGSSRGEHAIFCRKKVPLIGSDYLMELESGTHEQDIYDVSFAKGKNILCTLAGFELNRASYNKNAHIRRAKLPLYTPDIGHTGFQLSCISLSEDGWYLAAGASDLLLMYSIGQKNPSVSKKLDSKIHDVDFSPDSRHVVVACDNKHVYVYRVKDDK
jgi:WD40 repeat protein